MKKKIEKVIRLEKKGITMRIPKYVDDLEDITYDGHVLTNEELEQATEALEEFVESGNLDKMNALDAQLHQKYKGGLLQ